MRCISRKISTKGGGTLATPLLVPSFSSKVGSYKSDELKDLVKWCSEFLTDAMLLSAYDIHHGYHASPQELGEICEILFVDSGGYETSLFVDLSEAYATRHGLKEWNEQLLEKVISKIPKEYNLAIVNHDGLERPDLKTQTQAAAKFFDKFPDSMSDFLMHPQGKETKYLNLIHIRESLPLLSRFDIIGVTEKELGNTLMDRCQFLKELRDLLDSGGALGSGPPIHVFGSMDPVASFAYFMSGAEIFDGLTWLRFAYHNGFAIYGENYRFTQREATEKINSSKKYILQNNISEIERLKNDMVKFEKNKDFKELRHHGQLLSNLHAAINWGGSK